jgi:hypothetical protein
MGRKLTAGLLGLICTAQRYKDFLIAEATWKSANRDNPGCWSDEFKRWFFQLPIDRLKNYGLAHNEHSIQAVLDFEVTPEMLATEYNQLHKFKFAA